jgi:hypothetical protein
LRVAHNTAVSSVDVERRKRLSLAGLKEVAGTAEAKQGIALIVVWVAISLHTRCGGGSGGEGNRSRTRWRWQAPMLRACVVFPGAVRMGLNLRQGRRQANELQRELEETRRVREAGRLN